MQATAVLRETFQAMTKQPRQTCLENLPKKKNWVSLKFGKKENGTWLF
jgi:hypothetical protein